MTNTQQDSDMDEYIDINNLPFSELDDFEDYSEILDLLSEDVFI